MTTPKTLPVLHSPSTNRVIYDTINGSITVEISKESDIIVANPVHSAPIDMYSMSKSFTNEDVNDWETKTINKWNDLL